MTEGPRPTRTESVWLRVDGIKKGKGVLLLYPDKLAARAMARGSGRATIIPLDAIVSLRTGRSAALGDWFVIPPAEVTWG